MRRVLAIGCVLFAAACSVLRVPGPLIAPLSGEVSSGNDIRRTHATSSAFIPPLREVWTADAPAGFGPAAATIVDSLLFYGDLHGEVHIVRLRDGQEVGSKSYGSAIFNAPVFDRDTMYLAMSRSEPNLLAYSIATGTMFWKLNMPDIETELLRVGGRLYAATFHGTLFCVDKSSGSTIWKFEVPMTGRTRIVRSSPSSDGSVVVFGCDDGSMIAVSADSGTLRWRTPARESIVCPPAIDSGSVFFGSLDSSLYALDLATGRMKWSTDLRSAIFDGQAVYGGSIYTATAAGELYCLRGSDGSIRWSTPLKNMAGASPIVADTVVYVGCMDKHFYAYGAASGDQLWECAAEGRIRSIPVTGNGWMIVLTDDRKIHAFRSAGVLP